MNKLLPVEFLPGLGEEVVTRESKSGTVVIIIMESLILTLASDMRECCQGERRLGLEK